MAGLTLRPAILADVDALNALIRESVVGLSQKEYSPKQIESGMRHMFGIDTRLIEDGTYYVAESEGRPAGCGGWSQRRNLFGGDQYADRSDSWLDPKTEPAKIRAFFVHPDFARLGVASRLLDACERAAAAAGFRRLELMSTLPGIPFYAMRGFKAQKPVDLELPDGVRLSFVHMSKEIAQPPA